MIERKTTTEEVGKKPTYAEAVVLPGGGRSTEAAQALHQRIVVTSSTHGIVTLRYAPRIPKATEPIDTSS